MDPNHDHGHCHNDIHDVKWGLGLDNDPQKRKVLEEMLPRDRRYRVTAFKMPEVSNISMETQFTAEFDVNECTKEGAKDFLTEFSEITSTSYNMQNQKDLVDSAHVQWSGRRKCIHKVRKIISKKTNQPKPDMCPEKNTGCEAFIKFKLSKVSEHPHVPFCPQYKLHVTLHYKHNHPILAAASLKFQTVRPETRNQVWELFQSGHSASRARSIYKDMLLNKYKEQYTMMAANRGILPNYQWFFTQHALYMQQNFGRINSPEAYRLALQQVEEYNRINGTPERPILCSLKQTDSGDFMMACCDPLSSRVHEVLKESGSIVFCDATSNIDRQDSKFFQMLTVGPSGGLPLGFVLISRETVEMLTAGFELFKSILPKHAWKHRGSDGPVLWMTDDAEAEIKALG